MAVAGGNWWVDDPILKAAEDGLGRLSFVTRMASTLDQIGARPSSTVVALVGPWGSGKTSTVNLVLEHLDPDHWGISRLNPWALGSPDAIVAELLGAIGAALPKEAAKARSKLKSYAAAAAPLVPSLLGMIPVAGESLKTVSEMAVKRLEGESTLQGNLVQLSAELTQLGRPVLVFVDDVDRLQPDELLALFRAIRVLGRLPHVHYVVAYDQTTVLDLLMATPIARDRQDRALAFLEKIVTLPIGQPQIRTEQSAQLFNDGLTELLSSLGKTLGTEEARRLATEWEWLLVADLAEPRSISRFIAQLRVYLPLVGPDEVDLVDYLVITHLRMAYPALYRALLTDRHLLAGVAGDHLSAWMDGAALKALAVPEARRESLHRAVARLFPTLVTKVPGIRRRGIADSDYVDRYFTFTTAESDTTDAELLHAVRDWTAGPLPALVIAMLAPDASNREACVRSASLLRRLAGMTDQITGPDAGVLACKVTSYLPLPPGPGTVLGGPDRAVITALQALLSAAEDLDVPALLGAVAARGISGLVPFLQALPPTGEASTLAEAAADVAWQAFIDHVAAGDAAPVAPVESLFNLTEGLLTPPEANRRLQAAVDAGLSVADLAARLVQLGVDVRSGRSLITGFDASSLIQRLGPGRLIDLFVGLEAAVTGPDALPAGEWTTLRKHAVTMLVDAVAALLGERGPRIPALPEDVPQPFVNHHVSFLNKVEGGEPDLSIKVAVLLPAGDALPAGVAVAPGPIGHDREELIRAELMRSPVNRWLKRATSSGWPLMVEPWKITDGGDGRRITGATAGLSSTSVDSTGNQQRPVLALAHFRTGKEEPSGTSFLVADVEVGLWLTELNSDRGPDLQRHDSHPLPAALTQAELIDLIAETMGFVVSADVLYRALITDGGPEPQPIVRVEVRAKDGIDAVVDLSQLDRIGAGNSRPQTQVGHFRFAWIGPDGHDRFASEVRHSAVSLMAELLLRSGYRKYEESLLALLGS